MPPKKRTAYKSTSSRSTSTHKLHPPTTRPHPVAPKENTPHNYDASIKFPVSSRGKKLKTHFSRDTYEPAIVPFRSLHGDGPDCCHAPIINFHRYVLAYQSKIGTYPLYPGNPQFEYYAMATMYLFAASKPTPFPPEYGDFDSLRLTAGRLSHTNPKIVYPTLNMKMTVPTPSRAVKSLAACCQVLGSNYDTSNQPKISLFTQTLQPPTSQRTPALLPPTFANAASTPSPSPVLTENAAICKGRPPDEPTTAPHLMSQTPAPSSGTPGPAFTPEQPAPPVSDTGTALPHGRPPDTSTAPPDASDDPMDEGFTPVPTRPPPTPRYTHPTRRHVIRMRYRIQITPEAATPKPLTPRKQLHAFVTTVFSQLQVLDKSVILLPWALDSKAKCVLSPEALPDDTESPAWKHYASNQSTPKWKEGCWIQLAWAYDGSAEHFPSRGTNNAFYEPNKHTAYPMALHLSDKELEIGYLRWSGDFIDCDRLHTEFQAITSDNYIQRYRRSYTPLIIAFKSKSHKCLETLPRTDPKKPNWYGQDRPGPDKAIAVYCHGPQALACKMALKKAFEGATHFTLRPGSYDVTFVPADNVSTSGHDPAKKVEEANSRSRMNANHTAAMTHMQSFDVDCIQALDAPVLFKEAPKIPMPDYLWSVPGQPNSFPRKLTLRQVLLGLAHPLPVGHPPGTLDPNGGLHIVTSADRLLTCIDRVPKSYSSTDLVFRCITHVTRYDLARAFMVALPAWIHTFFGNKAFTTWIRGNIDDMEDESFDFAMGANHLWDGSWSSTDDNDLEFDLLNTPSSNCWNPITNLTEVNPSSDGTTTNPLPADRPVAGVALQPAEHVSLGEATDATTNADGYANHFKNAQDDDSMTIRRDESTVVSEAPTALADRAVQGDDPSLASTIETREPATFDTPSYNSAGTPQDANSLVDAVAKHHIQSVDGGNPDSLHSNPNTEGSYADASDSTPAANTRRRKAPPEEFETNSNSSTSSRFSKDKATHRAASPSDMPIDLTGNSNRSRKKPAKTPTSDDNSSGASVHSSTYSAPHQDGTPRRANSATRQQTTSNRADYSPPRSSFHNMDVDHWTGTAPDGASANSNDD
jgi:hypothetical protein